jgi:hypothetical protein
MVLFASIMAANAFAPLAGRLTRSGACRFGRYCTRPSIWNLNLASSSEPEWDAGNQNADVVTEVNAEKQPVSAKDATVISRLQNLVEEARQKAKGQTFQAPR